MEDRYDQYMDEIRSDMEREKKFQEFRRGLMGFILGGGVALILASAHDWHQLVPAVVVTAISELVLWMEGK